MTLADVKQALNIDFADQDEYLTKLLAAATARAVRITGIPEDQPEFINSEIENAILEDIAAMYQGRGENVSGSESSLKTYRRFSVKPMF